MLELAFKYKDDLSKKWLDWCMTDESKYFSTMSWRNYLLSIDDNNWDRIQFVSVNYDGNILGYFGATYHNDHFKFDNVFVILFEKNTLSRRDLYKFLNKLYTDPRANKIEWSVVIGNSNAEKLYEHMINKYNGRVVGIQLRTVRLSDGKLYDMKLFELFTNSMEKVIKK